MPVCFDYFYYSAHCMNAERLIQFSLLLLALHTFLALHTHSISFTFIQSHSHSLSLDRSASLTIQHDRSLPVSSWFSSRPSARFSFSHTSSDSLPGSLPGSLLSSSLQASLCQALFQALFQALYLVLPLKGSRSPVSLYQSLSESLALSFGAYLSSTRHTAKRSYRKQRAACANERLLPPQSAVRPVRRSNARLVVRRFSFWQFRIAFPVFGVFCVCRSACGRTDLLICHLEQVLLRASSKFGYTF